eukprot:201966-Rhodomonas_salina.2
MYDADRERESRVRCGVSGGGRGQAGGADCRVAPQRRCHGASLGLELGLDGGSGFSDDQDGLRCRDPRDLSLVVAESLCGAVQNPARALAPSLPLRVGSHLRLHAGHERGGAALHARRPAHPLLGRGIVLSSARLLIPPRAGRARGRKQQ